MYKNKKLKFLCNNKILKYQYEFQVLYKICLELHYHYEILIFCNLNFFLLQFNLKKNYYFYHIILILFFSLFYSGSDNSVAPVDDGGTQWARRQHAVSVRHAFKDYGSKSKPNHVLSNLNMTVAKGTM